jgi:hypothetical protein
MESKEVKEKGKNRQVGKNKAKNQTKNLKDINGALVY